MRRRNITRRRKIIKVGLIIILLVLVLIIFRVAKNRITERRTNFRESRETNIPEKESTIAEISNNEKGGTIENSSVNAFKPGDYRFTLTHNGAKRYYLLHVPSSYSGASTPLILAFHGGMGNAEGMERYGLLEKSDKEGFVLALPNGASRLSSGKLATWNAGDCCGHAVSSESDDIGFIKKVIKDIQGKINTGKIFATGMSNGGMISHRLACEMPDVFTAIAAVAGTNNYSTCNPKEPISILHIHSKKDQHVLFEGGCGPDCVAKGETEHRSVADTITGWLENNNCSGEAEKVFENKNAYCELYKDCDGDAEVKLCVTKDGGHSWPGTESGFKKNTPSQAISATDMIWDFFESR